MNIKKAVRYAAGAMSVMMLSMAGAAVSYADTADVPQEAAQQPAISMNAAITSCLVNSDKATVAVTVSSNSQTAGTDGNLYLFELQPYEDGIGGRTNYIGSAPAAANVSYQVALNRNTAQDSLYSKFAAAVYDGTKFVMVSEPHYITNPEMVAANTEAFHDPLTKKGLNIQLDMLNDAFDLGVKHVGTNIAFHQILGSGIDYEYDGKVYHFNKDVVESYDRIISALSGKGMTVTAIILNGWNDATPDLVLPGTAQNSNAFYYSFNAATQNGFEQTRAIASFLAERYSGKNSSYGKISNWIIGNEINNQQWNYIGPMELKNYIKEYQRAFRVFYTAVKSTSANDRLYFSLDYNWNTDMDHKLKYGGRNIVDSFNALANTEGQMEWGLSYHPYPAPMTEPEFWDDANTGFITQDFNSPIINFANLNVLTDYLAQSSLRTPSGEVRHVILTEQGFTATSQTRGNVEDLQAAAFAYSYYLVDSNPYIDAYILSRQVDAPSEVRSGLSFGLWECDMNQGDAIVATRKRKIWDVFWGIDRKRDTLSASRFAKDLLGVNKWSDVVPDFRWKSLETESARK